MAERSHLTDDADFTTLRDQGFSDEEIWDIGAIAALFALSNRLANMMSLRPNDEFYVMGRETRPSSDEHDPDPRQLVIVDC